MYFMDHLQFIVSKQKEESISALRFKAAHSVSIIKAHIRPNKKIGVFRVTGLKTLGRVGTLVVFLNVFFFWKTNNFMHFERHFAFQNA